MNKPDGGPAFPRVIQFPVSLRQWYAGLAMQGLLSNPAIHENFSNIEVRDVGIVTMSFKYADAMIAQGEKP